MNCQCDRTTGWIRHRRGSAWARLGRIGLAMLLILNPCGLTPSASGQQGHSRQRPPMRDVALGTNGSFVGQVLDADGRPVVGVLVEARQGSLTKQTETNGDGWFQFESLGGGTVMIATPVQLELVRAWAPGTAPPIASDRLLLISRGVVQRGQRPISELFLSDQILAGIIVAAAIAVPIAVHNSKKVLPNGS